MPLQVIRSLKRALQPALTDVSLEFKIDGKPEILQCPQTLPPIFAGEKLVIYALVKAKSDKLTGKAVLKGKLLQKSISDTVVFKSGAGEVSPVSTVHHLAAKALIKDWERERKDSKEIVKLSVESSVISSHTAFIAVDEENLKPIEGALQSFDVRAQYPHSRSRMMMKGRSAPLAMSGGMSGPPGGGGGGGRGGVNKKKFTKFRSAAPARRMASECSSGPPPMKCMASMASGPPPPPMMAPMFGGPPPPPMAPSMSGGPPPPPMASRYIDLSSSSGPPPPNSSSIVVVSLSSIIGAQQADGSWKMNAALARFVGKTLEEVESGCPTECQGVTALLWATLLILELLHTQYDDDMEEWELVGAKAETWTKKQSIPSGDTTLDSMKAAAKKLLA